MKANNITWLIITLNLHTTSASFWENTNITLNKRPVGLYSPLTAGIMTDFVIMIL